MKKVVGALAAFLYGTSALYGATLLPNGQQQFIDANGKPYANGKVYFYSNFPTCTILKNTYQNEAGTVLNTNPVVLSASGTATIFGTGAYCQVLKDQLGNTIWTKYTSDTSSASNLGWGGTSGGTANAQTVSVSSFAGVNGQTFYFIPSATNTGPFTLAVNSGSPTSVLKDTPSGPVLLAGGEVVTGNVVGVTYTSATGVFHLVTNNTLTSPGQISAYASTTCPNGWLVAQGQVLSSTTYSALYSAIGSVWNTGGEGAGNFRAPNLQGMFLRGTGTNSVYSSAVGPAVGQYQADSLLAHAHTDAGHTHTFSQDMVSANAGQTSIGSSSAGTGLFQNNKNSFASNSGFASIQSTGNADSNPKNFGVTYCIKY